MNLTTAKGMKSEVYAPVTPPPVWAPLTKALKDCKVGFATAGGIHIKTQEPFKTAGDFTYRIIPSDTPSSELMVTHGGFDNSDINKDVNAMLPIDRLHELAKEGFIGSVSPVLIGFMGGGGNVQKFREETGPAIAKIFKDEGVDVVLLTGGCGTCHRSATIVQRAIESVGISTIIVAALPPIAKQQGAPRIAAAHVPIGSNAGKPNNVEMQTAILKDSLNAMTKMQNFGELIMLPYEYRHNV
ncbi:D-proline reductase (dithiol) protein PrdB [Clostridium botulinum]|uniref:D-proline reductase, PrdB subunit n=1 Tax=Clostridium botulinum (strain Langeland / NCTC 10281 / Type F) TaxID=441772 RepID=A7GJH0_CLOBL|nr:D-proline reductase (dithiol) protein PrdB [Clostridium botulinum]ABS39494.1 D-proline reductase, PrdB subunit [Clostridium botulinum F str. Langeland]ADG01286.1 D-proline reductase, PrdB subunit [Clostridium botulinum F str. 230613]KKM43919.1 proline reductase [Clostridium botulinum]MBY6794226.1 D-proline reductase (dithiol) protein PrdB [Clostridium botulinum]MBY6939249.1 D-proline reductase (dithiol) protein PrdB [Clostridium botulinum]